MNIQEAITRSRTHRYAGGALLFSGALYYFVALFVALHRTAVSMGESPVLRPLGAVIQNFVASLYDTTAPFIGFVWRSVPTINQGDPFTYGNLLFLGLVGVMIVGKQLLLSGRRLKARIQRQMNRAQDMHWRNSIMKNNGTEGTTISAKAIGQVNVYQQPMPPNLEGEWWTRPWGLIGLTIISGYMVAVLAKLTGMI